MARTERDKFIKVINRLERDLSLINQCADTMRSNEIAIAIEHLYAAIALIREISHVQGNEVPSC